jgi:hypothetical protein
MTYSLDFRKEVMRLIEHYLSRIRTQSVTAIHKLEAHKEKKSANRVANYSKNGGRK